jgi:hypothetical protein
MFAKHLRISAMTATLGVALLLNLAGCPRPSPTPSTDPGSTDVAGAAQDSGTGAAGGTTSAAGQPASGNDANSGASSTGGGSGTPSASAPLASGGPDQNVEDGALVTLAGAGSDPTGGTVTFQWLQTAGTPVALSNPASAQPTFTAPTVTGTLQFSLTVQSTAGTATAIAKVNVTAAPLLFVVNYNAGSVVSYRKPAALNGDASPRTNLTGSNVHLDGPTSALLDASGSLTVANGNGNQIVSFFDGLTATGNAPPVRLVSNPGALLNDPEGLAYDKANDLLFVANFNDFPNSIGVYAGASLPNFSGHVAPTRRFVSIGGIINPRALHLAPNGELYVVNSGSHTVTTFAGAAALSGTVTATRTITSPALDNGLLLDMLVDANDRLYVVDANFQHVFMFAGASSLNGQHDPDADLVVAGAQSIHGIAIDRDGTGYVTDYVANAVYVFRNIAARTGTLAPDSIIQGPGTGLAGPWHLFLLER